MFAEVARKWLARWHGTRSLQHETDGKTLCRIENQLIAIAEIMLETPLEANSDLEGALQVVSFFDQRRPWMKDGHFQDLRIDGTYGEALQLLSTLSIDQLICDPWRSNHPTD